MAKRTPKRTVQILKAKRLLDTGFLRVDSSEIKYRLPDGALSDPQMRLNVDRGNAVAAILHERSNNTLHFVRQFRFSTYDESDEPSPDNGWILELIAGVVQTTERRDEAIKREIQEETGFKKVDACELIGSFFLTPGASSERLFLFYVAVDPAGRDPGKVLPDGAELRGADDEQIVTVTMTPEQFLAEVVAMRITDAKTVAAAEYVRRRREIFALA